MTHPAPAQATPNPALYFQAQTAEIEACLQAGLAGVSVNSPLERPLAAAVLGVGKRLRPLLTLAAYRYATQAVPTGGLLAVACAFELLHTASLIYDDLPAMDNAHERRGVAALHMAYGEATALLTAISLQNLAYQWVAAADELSPDVRLAVTHLMAQTVGACGLAAGQYYDLHGNPVATRHLKTGILFRAAAEAGALCAGADTKTVEEITSYADRLGTAFQILDDLQDHDAAEDEARLQIEMRQLLHSAAASLSGTRAAPLQDYITLVFGMAVDMQTA